VLNDGRYGERADIIREKGTTRVQFRRRVVDKYTWVDIGSSYLPGELVAAFLWAQLVAGARLTQTRREIWDTYHAVFREAEAAGRLRRPVVPSHCQHNGHLYYLLMRDKADRDRLIEALRADGILAPFHYIPLHSSPAGRRFGRPSGELAVTDSVSDRLIRLPLFAGLGADQAQVTERVLLHIEGS
jgi:dTDP-4-amino-4,6-dideoxygalactose transaminase